MLHIGMTVHGQSLPQASRRDGRATEPRRQRADCPDGGREALHRMVQDDPARQMLTFDFQLSTFDSTTPSTSLARDTRGDELLRRRDVPLNPPSWRHERRTLYRAGGR